MFFISACGIPVVLAARPAGILFFFQMLSTERLNFGIWSESKEDLSRAQRIWGNPAVMKYLSSPPELTADQVRDRLRREIETQKKLGIQYWPLFEKSSGDLVGCCGLKPWVHSAQKGPEHGFYLVPEKWGKGYAFEAAQRVIRYGFEELKYEQILAGHHPENIGSKKVLLKLGFQFLEPVFFRGTGLMHPSYRLSATEFRSNN